MMYQFPHPYAPRHFRYKMKAPNEQCFEKSRQLLLELQRQYFARQQHTFEL